MHSLSILGTSSDAGKSTLAFAITYLLHRRGIRVAPFKAQNVSNNARVCDDGGEIAQSQYFAAESIGLPIESDFNPVLLKSGRGSSASLIINGRPAGEQDVREYYGGIGSLKPVVTDAFRRLQKRFDVIVAEGAGSPVELNLMDKDLSNITIADTFDTKIILVADIERGGVFASVWGVYNLLPEKLRRNVIGVIINKFRGDITLFDDGRKIIEEQFGIRVLGVIPYKPFNLGFEDSQSLENYVQSSQHGAIRAAVIRLPHISNYTDFEPLIADNEVHLDFAHSAAALQAYDLVILPGTKRTVSDLQWLREHGFEEALNDFKGTLVAVCGGYEMMFGCILDPDGIESEAGTEVKGFGRLKGDIVFEKEKRAAKGCYELFGLEIEGYEIHHGKCDAIAAEEARFFGTFVHGLFDSDAFREKLFRGIDPAYRGYNFAAYKAKKIADFARHVGSSLDLEAVIGALHE
ncbi:cobyric acid synthase [Sulfurimonas sp. HSL3-7]|uniref:cobyric acid synthase n=1 Tax=Sulfonitrofixus jiaomeiensis TaxID=3131938 RepID=UPI0031F7E826